MVYEALGDYGAIIPSWILHPGVMSFVEQTDASDPVRRGFILLGFYEPVGMPPGTYVADLLAIAVEPTHQRQGIGRALLAYAIDVARVARRHRNVVEMRLTVADTNAAGRALFDSSGFRVLDEDHGNYDGGQRAIRMSLPLT